MRAKKFFGQHFLRDASVIAAIVEALELTGTEAVLEIGPGEGVLTEALVAKAGRVLAVDIDAEAVQTTRARIHDSRLEVIERDVLSYRVQEIGEQLHAEHWVLAGNLPYNKTSDLLQWMLQDGGPDRMVVMVQREVAQRMMAGAGEMNMLALFVQLHAGIRTVVRVSPGSFAPPPKVESMVVRLDRDQTSSAHTYGLEQPELFLAFARVAFAQKRKQLKTTLGALPQVHPQVLVETLEELGYQATARPEELSLEHWITLYHRLHGYC